MHHKIRLRDDPRIDSVVFFDEQLVLVAHLKQSKNSKIEAFKKVNSLEEFTGKQSHFAPEELLVFKIFDKVKVRVDTTIEFPLDISCTLVFGKEDLENYDTLFQEQEAKRLAVVSV